MSAVPAHHVRRDIDYMIELGALRSVTVDTDTKGTNRLAVVTASGTRELWTARQLQLFAWGVRTGRRLAKSERPTVRDPSPSAARRDARHDSVG